MNTRRTWRYRIACAAVSGLAVSFAIHADPDEAWLARAQLPAGMRPVLVLIVDRSAATAEEIQVTVSYDPLRNYALDLPVEVRCDPARAYWRRGPGPAPDCAIQAGLEISPADATYGLQCEGARSALARHGYFIASRAAQWRPSAAGGHWSSLHAPSPHAVECRSDRGRHGAMAGNWYAVHGAAGPWSNDAASEISWERFPHADPYIFYGGNFLNYRRTAPTQAPRSFADHAAISVAAALEATDELESALVRVSDRDGAGGGYIARAPVASTAAASEMRADLARSPAGGAPLAGTLAETMAWLAGGTVRYGDDERADRAAVDDAAGGRYRSPFTHACRPITLAYLTAGQGTGDDLAAIAQRIGQTDLRDDLPGAQAAPLFWIAPSPTPALINQAAGPATVLRGDDPIAYVNLVAHAHLRDAAVPGTPRLSAAAMVPAADAVGTPGIAFGLSAPLKAQRWAGNLFRYRLRAPDSPFAPPAIVDRDGEPAMDSESGLPRPSSRSLWSDAPDSSLLTGGAAGRLPTAGARQLFADLAASRILDPDNRLAPGNPRVDRALLGLGTHDAESADDILSWIGQQRTLGDPGLHAPVIADYPASGQQLAFAVTQDGLLHAFDADSGIERWAFMPRQLLRRLPGLMRDQPTTVRDHGVDAAPVLHRYDPDGDGEIDAAAGEHLWLLFGLGRGGNRYFALDVSDADDPHLLWSISLPATTAVESWAEPVVTRLAIADSGQSEGDWVVLLAGGYDRQFDANGSVAGAGNSLQVVDAMTGRQLWHAGGDGTADLRLPGLAASLPSAPRALDLDGDARLDRLYLVDIAGNLWRLDFRNGNRVEEVAQARLLARLGTGTQRFHATPDVSLARVAGRDRLAIAIGSGWLAQPRDAAIVDRIYVVFDRDLSGGPDALAESDLYDATDGLAAMPASASGWFLRLDRQGAGEKVIGPTVTFNHLLRFQTYQPLPDGEMAPCGPPRAIHRLRALDIRSGLPHGSVVEAEADDEQTETGLPAGLRFGFPGPWNSSCADCPPRPFGIRGAETFDPGYSGDPVRTSWRKLDLPPDSR